jgi:hypothetical protein
MKKKRGSYAASRHAVCCNKVAEILEPAISAINENRRGRKTSPRSSNDRGVAGCRRRNPTVPQALRRAVSLPEDRSAPRVRRVAEMSLLRKEHGSLPKNVECSAVS